MLWICYEEKCNGVKEVKPVEPMTPAAVEVNLRGDAGTTAGELETGCKREESTHIDCFCNLSITDDEKLTSNLLLI